MKKQTAYPTQETWREYDRRAEEVLQVAREALLSEYPADFVSINPATGEYVHAATRDGVSVAFKARWPNQLAYTYRVDGRPVTKFHGK